MDYSRLQWTASVTPPPGRRQHRLAAALGVERRALDLVLTEAQHNLYKLRSLTLTDLLALAIYPRDAERIFYLVQWEQLQAHLEVQGELPETGKLTPLLDTLAPIFERHFSQGARLNETLVARYRAELGRDTETCLTLTPPNPAKRFLLWLGLIAPA